MSQSFKQPMIAYNFLLFPFLPKADQPYIRFISLGLAREDWLGLFTFSFALLSYTLAQFPPMTMNETAATND